MLKVLQILACTFLLTLLCACVAPSELYRGKSVSTEQSVLFQEGGVHAESFATFDVLIDYKHERVGDLLELSGQAMLGQHYQRLYTTLNALTVYLFFVDQDSHVLQSVSLVDVRSENTDSSFFFSHSLAIPQGAKGFAFGYQGDASELDGYISFHKIPQRF